MKKIIIIFTLLISYGIFAQTTTPNLLTKINRASQAEIDAYNSAELEIGMLVYNTDADRIFEYTSTGFTLLLTTSDITETVTELDIAAGELTYTNEDASNANVNLISLDADNSITAGTDGALFVPLPDAETVTSFEQNDVSPSGEITYIDEAGDAFTAQVVSTDADNQIEVGTDGGSYLGPTVYTGFFIIDNTTLTTTGTYAQNVTGIPFQPSQITFVAHPNIGDFDINDDNGAQGPNTGRLDNTHGTMNGFGRAGAGGISQAVIFSGASGSSVNDITRYSNDDQCIGLRYTNNNGSNLGVIDGVLTSFTTTGFNLNITYTLGTVGNTDLRNDILDQNVIVLYTAYK